MPTSFVGHRVPVAAVHVRREPLRLPLPLVLAGGLLRALWRLLLAVAGSPVAVTVLTVATVSWAAWSLWGAPLVAVGFVLVVAMLAATRIRWPALFERWIVLPLRSRWLRFSVYRYKWAATMDLAELNRYRHDGRQYAPILLSVRSTRNLDRVRVRMLAAQTVDDWGKVSDRLCQTFGAQDCRVRSVPGRPHEVEAWFLVDDPLEQVVQPREITGDVPLAALPVGLREDGEVYRLPLLGNHVLVVGKTGAGKSSVEWAVVDALAPCIADGTVQLIGIDPKADELSFGEPLFAQLAFRDPSDFAAVLEEAVAVMQRRQLLLRGQSRLHQPSKDEPLLVVLVDELAALSYTNERDVRRRIENALGLLLSQGRAVGVSVIGCTQDPRKEVISNRGLYTVRVLLAVNEEDDVGLVLDRGARDRGARADKIPANLQGVGFVEVDGEAEPIRVRFAFVTDDHIRTLVGGWKPPGLSLVPDLEDQAA